VTATRRRLLGLAAGLVLADAESSSRAQSPDEGLAARLMDDLMWNRGPIGGPFALIDHTGQPRADTDFRGKLLLIYFGYTNCPDICPADLMQIGLAMNELGPAGEAVQPLFITLDPERDTAARLADYGVDHSSFVYLIDGTGKYIGFFPPGTTAERMIEMITPHLRVNEYGR